MFFHLESLRHPEPSLPGLLWCLAVRFVPLTNICVVSCRFYCRLYQAWGLHWIELVLFYVFSIASSGPVGGGPDFWQSLMTLLSRTNTTWLHSRELSISWNFYCSWLAWLFVKDVSWLLDELFWADWASVAIRPILKYDFRKHMFFKIHRLLPSAIVIAGPPCSLFVAACQSVHARSLSNLAGNVANAKVRLANRIWANFVTCLISSRLTSSN